MKDILLKHLSQAFPDGASAILELGFGRASFRKCIGVLYPTGAPQNCENAATFRNRGTLSQGSLVPEDFGPRFDPPQPATTLVLLEHRFTRAFDNSGIDRQPRQPDAAGNRH